MGVEIERKFVVRDPRVVAGLTGTKVRQGYLSTEPGRVVRVRHYGEHGRITIKGPGSGAARPEYEYEIPVEDADEMLDTLAIRPLVEKTRYRLPIDDVVWEIDVFEGVNAGLAIAEVELPSDEHAVTIPEWAGREVTSEARYYNASLARHPYSEWSAAEREG